MKTISVNKLLLKKFGLCQTDKWVVA